MRRMKSVFGFGGIILFVALFGAVRAYRYRQSALHEHETVIKQIDERKREVATLEEKLRHFESGEGLELEARSRLNLQRPDEKVLIILDDKTPQKEKEDIQRESIMKRIQTWLGF